jgi:hypothetical protein
MADDREAISGPKDGARQNFNHAAAHLKTKPGTKIGDFTGEPLEH